MASMWLFVFYLSHGLVCGMQDRIISHRDFRCFYLLILSGEREKKQLHILAVILIDQINVSFFLRRSHINHFY